MVDMLSKAQEWLSSVRKNSLATDRILTYVRQGTNERIYMTGKGVVIGNADERLDESVATALDVEERDYIIPREIFETHPWHPPISPERGDIIEETDVEIYKFRVVTQGGETAWEWHDRERTAYRVHCHLIGTE